MVRWATKDDVSGLFTLLTSSESNEPCHYEVEALVEWVSDRNHNILLVTGDDLDGFIFCKRISLLWWVLDGLYVRPEARQRGIGSMLMDNLEMELVKIGAKYLSSLVVPTDAGFMIRRGFMACKEYRWFGKNL